VAVLFYGNETWTMKTLKKNAKTAMTFLWSFMGCTRMDKIKD
jgi:hypothetical protein